LDGNLREVFLAGAVPQRTLVSDVGSAAGVEVLLPVEGVGAPPSRALDELYRHYIVLIWVAS
jgi:hypothetical protein